MGHLADADLIARLDGEQASGRDGSAAHLAACPACRTRLIELEATLVECSAAVRLIDAVEPAWWTDSPELRLRRAGSVDAFTPRAARPAGRPIAWRWAAALLLFLAGAGASGAILVHYLVPGPRHHAPGATHEVVDETGDVAGTIMVQPSQDTIRITIRGAGLAPPIDADVHARGDVSITIIGTVAPRFAARDGSVEVTTGDAPSRVQIRFPATIRSGTIIAEGTEVLRIVQGTIVPLP